MTWTYQNAGPELQRQALQLILRPGVDSDAEALSQADELLMSCQKGALNLDGLIIVFEASRPVGIELAIVQQDGTAHVWPPVLWPGGQRDADRGLADLRQIGLDCISRLKTTGTRMAQCVTPLMARKSHEILEIMGFEPLAQLVGMQHVLEDIPHATLPDECEFSTYQESDNPRFEKIMEATFASSQDCAGLRGRRSAAECLASHRFAGVFNPELWQLFHTSNEDVGIMLCADHQDQRMWELLYLGVVPKFRKQGIALAMLSDMLWHAKVSGAESVFLAVDASNIAARSLYEMAGFVERIHQQIHIWTNV